MKKITLSLLTISLSATAFIACSSSTHFPASNEAKAEYLENKKTSMKNRLSMMKPSMLPQEKVADMNAIN
ncbi:MAG TPA: hypothetical protein DCS15_10855 [Flavobacteriales bacterium]|jgi:hypothetical protein|nr:hypothetical protein [Salibacteraceae bacterium]HAS36976.1 hypothetical protein [Flavobacteriales bacterium]